MVKIANQADNRIYCGPLKGQADSSLKHSSKVSFRGEDDDLELSTASVKKFSIEKAVKNFGKGLISPITSIFDSPASVAVTAGVGAIGYTLLRMTKNKIGPLFVAAGVLLGAGQTALGVHKVIKAKNSQSREDAFIKVGSGAGTVVLSALAARSLLAPLNEAAKDMSMTRATLECLRPKTISDSFSSSLTLLNNEENAVALVGAFTGKKPPIAAEAASAAEATHSPAEAALVRKVAPISADGNHVIAGSETEG